MSGIMTPAEYNQFIIEHVVDHDGNRYEEKCPCCNMQAIKHIFETCHSGSINKDYTLNCEHCGHHSCDQDFCQVCDAKNIEYDKRMLSTFELDALAEHALENASTGVNPAVFTRIKEMLCDEELYIDFGYFCFSNEPLHRGNFMNTLDSMTRGNRAA
ncbi:hypothetical protein [Shewanella sp. GD03713]|uniref:hypothetical protein n=1 Tax=Shewanella sp. GD03713 TaxID=2975372 RepID=UPI002449523A|nr:hypothetical protein [Shewanella sp. GD03713]MDH1472588.1 hypothetical protein [Shewanella sp. GD03713]